MSAVDVLGFLATVGFWLMLFVSGLFFGYLLGFARGYGYAIHETLGDLYHLVGRISSAIQENSSRTDTDA